MIERLLQEYAKKRRDDAGAPLELSPANRKSLLAEAARLFPPPQAAAAPAKEPWWTIWWPRFAVAGFAAVLVLLAVTFWPRDNAALKLAKSSQPAESQVAQREESSVDPKTGRSIETLALREPLDTLEKRAERIPAGLPDSPLVAESETLAPPPAGPMTVSAARALGDAKVATNTNRSGTGDGLGGGGTRANQENQVLNSKPPAPMLAAAPMVQASAEFRTVSTQQLHFAQTSAKNLRRNFNSPPPLKVLTTFELQRTGDSIRVIDADGSVYEGRVVSAGTGPFSNAELFRVAGTNQTLNQLVVFAGQILAEAASTDLAERTTLSEQSRSESGAVAREALGRSATSQMRRTLDRGATEKAALSEKSTEAAERPLTASPVRRIHRIDGKATVGSRQELHIEAREVMGDSRQ